MPDPKPSLIARIANYISSYFSTSKTKDASTQRNTSVSPPISRTTSPFSEDSEDASQASTKGSETASVTSENKSRSAGEVLRENIALALAKQEALSAQESSRHQKEFDNARQQAKIIAGEKSKTSQTPLDSRIQSLVSKTERLKGLVLGLQTSTTSPETPQKSQRLRGSETLIGTAIIPPAPPKENTTTTTSATLSSEVGSINFYDGLPLEKKLMLKQNFSLLPGDLQSAISEKEQSNSSQSLPATTRATSHTRAKERGLSANEYHGLTLAQENIDYEEGFNAAMREKKTDNWNKNRPGKIKSNGGPDSTIPSTLKDRNGEYKVAGGIRYYGTKKAENIITPQQRRPDGGEDTEAMKKRGQDRAKEIEAMKKRGAEAKTDYEEFTRQQKAREAEQKVEIQHRKLVASQNPTGNSSWPQSNQYIAHGSTNNYAIDTSPQNNRAQRKPDPNSGLAERAEQRRSQSGPTRWEGPAITQARNNAKALNASQSAQTSKTSGARRLTEDKENNPPGHEDPLNTHYAEAFPSTTKSGFVQRVLAGAITGGIGVKGGRGAGG